MFKHLFTKNHHIKNNILLKYFTSIENLSFSNAKKISIQRLNEYQFTVDVQLQNNKTNTHTIFQADS